MTVAATNSSGDGRLAVTARDLTKAYGSTVACDRIDLDVADGTVHALLGENGAGKSSFVKLLFGLSRPTSGSLSLWGRTVDFASPAEALEAGVGMVHQHFSLAPNLSAEENLLLGGPLLRRIDRAAVREAAAEHANAAGLDVTFGVPVGDLGVGDQQRVEILRSLLTGARLLILDEPTAVLSEAESAGLLRSVRRLAANGTTVLLITHRMDDVFAGSDHVTVLRGGRVTLDAPTDKLNHRSLVTAITGDDLQPYARQQLHEPQRSAAPVLRMREVSVEGWKRSTAIDSMNLSVAKGEIVGIAGVEGNGQRQLCEALTGSRPLRDGIVELDGVDLAPFGPAERFGLGLALIPEDRHAEGLMLPLSAAHNYAHGVLGFPDVRLRRIGLSWRRIREHFEGAVGRFDIRPAGHATVTGTMSGGNQQKVVVSRVLAAGPSCIVASQPTRGVDLGAAEDIRNALVGSAKQGAGVVLVSADLDELLSICHRIVVICRGCIVWEGAADRSERESMIGAMTGGVGSDGVTQHLDETQYPKEFAS